MPRAFVFAAMLVAAVATSGARADVLNPHVDLVCDAKRNVAVARFAEAYNEEAPSYAAVPKAVDRGLSTNPPTRRQICRLGNGWEVKVRSGRGQAFPYGAGGGSPPGYFSLWVDRRKVISGQVWTEYSYDQIRTPTAAVVVKPGRLTVCEGRERVRCKSERLDLSSYDADRVEYPTPGEERPPAGTIEILKGAQSAVCRDLIKRRQTEDGTWFEWFDLTDENDGTWPSVSDIGRVFGVGEQHGAGSTTFPPDGTDDIDGDGVDETVVRRFGENRSFDGSYWIVAPQEVRVIDVFRRIYPDAHLDEEAAIELAEQQGWSVYSGGRPGLYPDVSPRYVHVEMLRRGGETLFLARPTVEEHQPTAVLIRPKPRKQFETVCEFQEVLPNF